MMTAHLLGMVREKKIQAQHGHHTETKQNKNQQTIKTKN